MQKKNNIYHDFTKDEYTSYRKGIDYQREIFKHAMHSKEYDSAVSSLQNITIEIKKKAIMKGGKKKIIRINKICRWYRNIPLAYTKRYEYGYDTVYPSNIEQKIIHNLNIAYELLCDQLNALGYI